MEQLVELFGARACYASLNLFVAYNQRVVHSELQDPTAFQSPLGALCHTHLVMGYTNSIQIMQGDINYILRHEIPLFTIPFIYDVTMKGPVTHYENTDNTYKTIPENSGIRRFIWEHLANINQILQRLKYVSGTFSGKTLKLCISTIVILGQRCNYEGCVPHEAKTQMIQDWPIPIYVTSIRSFLGTCGLVWIFIKDFAKHAHPLVNLTCKYISFHFGAEEIAAMENIKDLVTRSPVLHPLNYATHDWRIILAVDSSITAVGYVLMQVRDEKHQFPSRFGSIAWMEHESRYLLAKPELYGLFCALRAYHIYIIGVKNLVIEVDAKYRMLNNPDIQPNATINRWIADILLFDFKLVHVPAIHHTAADGLSCRLPAPEDPPETDDFEEWIDDSYRFFMELANWRPPHLFPSTLTMCPLFTQIICPSIFATSASVAVSASAFITEETSDDDSNNIPHSQRASAANVLLAEVEEYLQFLTHPQGLSDSDFHKFMQYSSGFLFSNGKLWQCDTHGKHKIVVPKEKRYKLLKEVHDILGHKKIYAVWMQLLEQFWWSFLNQDVKWFVQTCHQCQVHQMCHHHIPPTVTAPTSLFHKAHVDTMYMPRALGYCYIVQARCSLSSYPEHWKLHKENGSTIGAFIFKEILCRWGALEGIVTDNGPAFVEALNWLAEQYGIHLIRISPYNSQVNGIVKHHHLDVREAIIKVCDGEERKWPTATHAVFWAERIMTHKALGHSAYYIAHGVEPLLLFDLAEATYMVLLQSAMSTTELIVL
jgi:hypothetical protein